MGEVDRWANIQPDLLNEISKQFYSYDDYIRLRLVCKEWNSELPKTPNHKRNPWLVLPGRVDETLDIRGLDEEEINRINPLLVLPGGVLDNDNSIPEEEKIYHLTLPEVNDDNIIRGSCYGWLIFVKKSDGTLRMLNPFTKAHFDLPPISTFPDVIAYHPDIRGEEYIRLDIRIGEPYKVESTLLHKIEVWKVVISSPPDIDNDDFMAVVVYGMCRRLAFYKHDDSRWIDIPTTGIEPDFQDVIFFQEKIYAIDYDCQLYVFDTKTKPLPLGGIIKAVSPPEILNKYLNSSMNKYLIGCDDGNLLMLVRHVDCLDSNNKRLDHYQTYSWDIFKLNRDVKEWSRVYNLENYTLMIGHNSSIQVLPHTISNGNGNRMYYTDNQVELHSSESATVHDIGILNIEDRSTKNLLLDDKFLCPPVWLLLP